MEKDIAQMRAELRDFYFKNVKPNLADLNKRRKKNLIAYYGMVMILLGFIVVFFSIGIGLFLIIAGFAIAMFLGREEQTSAFNGKCVVVDSTGEEEFKKKYMPEFLKIFGGEMLWSKDNIRMAAQDLNVYRKLNIMNPYFILSFDDMIYGKYKGVNFNILECDTSLFSANNFVGLIVMLLFGLPFVAGFLFIVFAIVLPILFTILGKSAGGVTFGLFFILIFVLPLAGLIKFLRRVPFRGVFVEFDMNKNFEGHTFLFENAQTNHSIKFNHSKFQEVKLEDSEFCKKYKIYSDNQVEARYVLTTAFIERFKNMKTAFKAEYIRAAFKDGKITIALHAGRDLFAMASLNKDSDSNTFTELFDEILSVLELIEALKLNQNIGL